MKTVFLPKPSLEKDIKYVKMKLRRVSGHRTNEETVSKKQYPYQHSEPGFIIQKSEPGFIIQKEESLCYSEGIIPGTGFAA